MAQHAKHELVEFLIREAFDPVLKANPSGRSEHDQRKLEDVKQATEKEVERFRNYASVEEVLTNFRHDLSSAPAKKVQNELTRLQLPTLHDVRDAFERRAEALGVGVSK